jgi:Cu+-exporting ATPase
LIKTGETLEKSNKIDCVVFDKTGTLTEGKPKVINYELRITNYELRDKEQDSRTKNQEVAPLTPNPSPSATADREGEKQMNVDSENKNKEEFEKEFLQKIMALEKLSEHPLAGAVVEYLGFMIQDSRIGNKIQDGEQPSPLAPLHSLNVEGNKTSLLSRQDSRMKVENFQSIAGTGVMAEINGEKIMVGRKNFLEENGIILNEELLKIADEWQKKGQTVVWGGEIPISNIQYPITNGETGEKIIPNSNLPTSSLIKDPAVAVTHLPMQVIFGIADKVKESSLLAVQRLQARGVEVVMLTGDNKHTALAVAEFLGIKNVIAEVFPSDKANVVKALQGLESQFRISDFGFRISFGKRVVAFVGDGINDAPALAVSDLGIAMGTGTDIAKETGDIIIVQGSPAKVYEAIILSQKTFAIIRENLFWAFIYNIVGIPIAALGYLSPVIAALAMAFSSVSVVGNSLRIKRIK